MITIRIPVILRGMTPPFGQSARRHRRSSPLAIQEGYPIPPTGIPLSPLGRSIGHW